MPKPRARGTSTETKRPPKPPAGRSRKRSAAPLPPAGTAKPAKRAAGGRTRAPQTKAGKPAALRESVERAASPIRRAAKPRGEEQARQAPPKRARPGEAAEPPPAPTQRPDLDWDDGPRGPRDDLVARWAARGQELFEKLAAHGASRHEYRADLKEGRFVWLAPSGRVSAEARAQVLCSWSRATSVVAMAWADPVVRSAGVSRIDGMLAERDDIDEAGAWRIAMEAAEANGAVFLYRVSAPHAWYFLGLRDLTFSPKRASFHPGTPVGLVLQAICDVREAIESRAEPAAVVRFRLRALGSSLYHQAKYAYRATDWVARLDRTGARLMHLAKRIPRASFSAVAAGQRVSEWLERDLAIELIEALGLLEDEWSVFG